MLMLGGGDGMSEVYMLKRYTTNSPVLACHYIMPTPIYIYILQFGNANVATAAITLTKKITNTRITSSVS